MYVTSRSGISSPDKLLYRTTDDLFHFISLRSTDYGVYGAARYLGPDLVHPGN